MDSYLVAVSGEVRGAVELLVRLALPLSAFFGLLILAAAILASRDPSRASVFTGRRLPRSIVGCALVALTAVIGWGALKTAAPRARREIAWRESTEATTNPVPDAPDVLQYAPSLAALTEKTYSRTLTLPPDFFQRIGTEGLGVLAPYLSDPSATDVLALVDTFRRSGRDVVFTRNVTRLDEEPIAFDASTVRVRFERLAGRAYDLRFEAHYHFQNGTDKPVVARFQLPLPQGGTVRELSVAVGKEAAIEPDDAGTCEWKSTLSPGERREAVVRYRVLGARTWRYDLGSRRRRVKKLTLDAEIDGAARFVRGSLLPTGNPRGPLRWELTDIVTAQQVALEFPPDVSARDGYLQALAALPAALLAFLLGALALVKRSRESMSASLGGLVLFGLGLGCAPVLANYLGSLAGVLLGPLAGALLAIWPLGRRVLLASIPAAILPAAFLSPRHSGLIVLALAAVTLTVLWRLLPREEKPKPETAETT